MSKHTLPSHPDRALVGIHCSVAAKSCSVLCDPVDCSMPGFRVLQYLPEFAQTRVHSVGDTIQSSHSLPPPSLPALSFSQHQGLFSDSTLCIRWAKYWCFSFSINPFNIYSEFMSFRSDWFDLLALHLKLLLDSRLNHLSHFPTPSQSPTSGHPGLLPDAAWPSPFLTSPWVWLVIFFSVFFSSEVEKVQG